MVVLEHKDHRQALDGRPVQSLVKVAAGGGAVAQPRERAARLAAQLEGHRHSGGHEHHVGQHRDHADASEAAITEVDISVTPARDAARQPHVLRKDAPGLHAPHEVRGEIPVQHAEAVLRRHRECGARRHCLLAKAVIEGPGDLALPIELERALLDPAHHEHEAQQLHTVAAAE